MNQKSGCPVALLASVRACVRVCQCFVAYSMCIMYTVGAMYTYYSLFLPSIDGACVELHGPELDHEVPFDLEQNSSQLVFFEFYSKEK